MPIPPGASLTDIEASAYRSSLSKLNSALAGLTSFCSMAYLPVCNLVQREPHPGHFTHSASDIPPLLCSYAWPAVNPDDLLGLQGCGDLELANVAPREILVIWGLSGSIIMTPTGVALSLMLQKSNSRPSLRRSFTLGLNWSLESRSGIVRLLLDFCG